MNKNTTVAAAALTVLATSIFFMRKTLFGAAKRGAATSVAKIKPYSAAWVTVPNMEVGKALAKDLVEKKLCACVNIVPGVTSVYWWDNKVNEDSELLLMIKTRTELVPDLVKRVTSSGLHPYSNPEVISVPIDQGSDKYLQWIGESTTSASAESKS